MITERLDIGGTLVLEAITYEAVPGYKTFPRDVSFEFIEHSPAHGYSDSTTSITIDEPMARKIIDTLNKHFEFGHPAPAQAVDEAAIPLILLMGFDIYSAMTEREKLRTSAENVSDVLDAAVRVMRSEGKKEAVR